MSRARLIAAAAMTVMVIAVAAAGVVYVQAQSRTQWRIDVYDLGDNALLDRCVDRDLVEESTLAPTMPPTLATVDLRTGVSRAEADAAAECLTDGGATASVIAIDT